MNNRRISPALIASLVFVSALVLGGNVDNVLAQDVLLDAPPVAQRQLSSGQSDFGEVRRDQTTADPFGGDVTDPANPFRSGNQIVQRHAAAESEIRQLAQRIQSGEGDGGDAEKLREIVTRQLNVQLQRQRSELSLLNDRIRQIEQSLTARERNRERIVDRRVEELLDPTVQWEERFGIRTRKETTANKFAGQGYGVSSKDPGQATSPGGNLFGASSADPDAVDAGLMKEDILRGPGINSSQSSEHSPLRWKQLLRKQKQAATIAARWQRIAGAADRDDVTSGAQSRTALEIAMRDWRDHWQEYQASLRNLELELEGNAVQVEGLRSELKLTEAQFANGTLGHSDVLSLKTQLRKAEVEMQQASERLDRLRGVETNEPELNPDKFDPSVSETSAAGRTDSALNTTTQLDPSAPNSGPAERGAMRERSDASRNVNRMPTSAPMNGPANTESAADWATVLGMLTEARKEFENEVAITRIKSRQREELLNQMLEVVDALSDVDDQDEVREQLDLTGHWIQSVDSAGAIVRKRVEELEGDAPVSWRQAWAFYQHTLKLLELDVREAELRVQQASEEFARIQKLFESNAASESEYSRTSGALRLAELQLQRAKERLESYHRIVEEDPTLDPQNRDVQGLNSPLMEIPAEALKKMETLRGQVEKKEAE